MASQKSSSRPLETINITFQDDRQVHFVGYFKVSVEGDWIVINKINDDSVVFATMAYFRPKSFVWKEKPQEAVPV